MKIIVISDTHGDIERATEILREQQEIDLVIHLGDYFRDAQRLAEMFPQVKMEYVYGNSDFMMGEVAAEKLLECGGKRIFITHGHRYSVKWDYRRLCQKAEETNADILLFGHTHVADLVRKDGYILLNPGSISDPREDTSESYAMIEISGSTIEPKLIFL